MEIDDRGIRLKELRKKRRLSQKEVADRIGVATGTISAYECNTKTPSVEVLESLALLYNASVDYILGLDKRTNFYIDDLTASQQEIVLNIVRMLREEFEKN